MTTSISTKEWMGAGLPFEGWLRYTQLTREGREHIELEFIRRYGKQVN